MTENVYGCRVVQRLLEHCAASQLSRVLQEILSKVKQLAVNNFGNYVVQHILEHGRPEDKKQIIQVVTGNIVEFAKHKCSSNVVEKCLEVATIGEHSSVLEDQRAALVQAILEGTPGNPAPIHSMLEDRYG